MRRAGMVGALPWPAWGAVAGMLSSTEDDSGLYRHTALRATVLSPEGHTKRAWRATVLSLRRTCKALAELVGAGCVGGAGRLEVETANKAAQLGPAVTAGLGRALVVTVRLDLRGYSNTLLKALTRALAVAVERGHMILLDTLSSLCALAEARMIEAALIEASRKGLLLYANLHQGEWSGWSADAMAQLSVVQLLDQERETIATLAGAGTLQRITLDGAEWADMSILSSLREVKLFCCAFVEDLSPLADVPRLVVWWCRNIKALPAMRNDVLEVLLCNSLTDVSGLAGGRVGRLELWRLDGVKDVSAIGEMQPPPRTVILREMDEVQDVSMLAGIHRLEVISCPKLDKAATLAALEGKVGTIRWRERAEED